MSIPKILHCVGSDGDRRIEPWKALNPGWEIRLYDAARMQAFVAQHHTDDLPLFAGYSSAEQRVDMFRYGVLAAVGGVFVDLDTRPLRGLDEFAGRVDCFVGVEPESHARDNVDGMPFRLSNRLMGSVPGHRFWAHVFGWLRRCDSEVVATSTGNRMLTGAALTVDRDSRPMVLLPEFWAAEDQWGREQASGWEFLAALGDQFETIGGDEASIARHRFKRLGINWFMQMRGLPEKLRWRMRKRKYPQLDAVAEMMPRVEPDYGRQMLEPYGADEWPTLVITVDAHEVTDAAALTTFLLGLDYPADRVTLLVGGAQASALLSTAGRRFGSAVLVSTEGSPAKRRNGLAEQAMEYGDFCLFVDGRVVGGDADAARKMLAARRPVVSANCGVDGWTLRYNDRAFFERFYEDGITNGAIGKQGGQGVSPLERLRHLRIAPLDCVGAQFLLVESAVLKARVRFAERGYMMHGDGGGFAILARQSGFEVCGLPEVRVHLRASYGVNAPKS